MKLLYSWFHIAIFDIFGDISGAGLSQGPAFGALYRALGAPDKKMIETRNRVRVWGKLFYFRSYVENVDSFWVLLSTKIDWNTESRKVGNSESRKVGNSESLKCRQIRKNFFSSFFLDQMESKSEKKTKVKILKSSDISSSRFCATRPKGWRPRESEGPRGRGQGPEGVSYRLPPISENKRDEGFILLLSYWSIIHEIGGGIPFLPLWSKRDVGGGRHGPDLNKPYYIPFSSRKRWNLLGKSDFSILSWLRIELMTSQLARVLSKGVILEVKEKTNTCCSRSDVGKVEIFLRK